MRASELANVFMLLHGSMLHVEKSNRQAKQGPIAALRLTSLVGECNVGQDAAELPMFFRRCAGAWVGKLPSE